MKLSRTQLRGEHGTVETKVVNGVVVNASDADADAGDATTSDDVNYSKMTKAELIEALDEKGIAHADGATKTELLELITAA